VFNVSYVDVASNDEKFGSLYRSQISAKLMLLLLVLVHGRGRKVLAVYGI